MGEMGEVVVIARKPGNMKHRTSNANRKFNNEGRFAEYTPSGIKLLFSNISQNDVDKFYKHENDDFLDKFSDSSVNIDDFCDLNSTCSFEKNDTSDLFSDNFDDELEHCMEENSDVEKNIEVVSSNEIDKDTKIELENLKIAEGFSDAQIYQYNLFPEIWAFQNKAIASLSRPGTYEQLEKLLDAFIKMSKPYVDDCKHKPNRSARFKTIILQYIIFFKYYFDNVPEPYLGMMYYHHKMAMISAMYFDTELRASTRKKEPNEKICSRMYMLSSYVLGPALYTLEAVFYSYHFTNRSNKLYREICMPILKKLLSNDVDIFSECTFVKYMLAFKLLKNFYKTLEERNSINKTASAKFKIASFKYVDKLKSFKDILPQIPATKKDDVTRYLLVTRIDVPSTIAEFCKILEYKRNIKFNDELSPIKPQRKKLVLPKMLIKTPRVLRLFRRPVDAVLSSDVTTIPFVDPDESTHDVLGSFYVDNDDELTMSIFSSSVKSKRLKSPNNYLFMHQEQLPLFVQSTNQVLPTPPPPNPSLQLHYDIAMLPPRLSPLAPIPISPKPSSTLSLEETPSLRASCSSGSSQENAEHADLPPEPAAAPQSNSEEIMNNGTNDSIPSDSVLSEPAEISLSNSEQVLSNGTIESIPSDSILPEPAGAPLKNSEQVPNNGTIKDQESTPSDSISDDDKRQNSAPLDLEPIPNGTCSPTGSESIQNGETLQNSTSPSDSISDDNKRQNSAPLDLNPIPNGTCSPMGSESIQNGEKIQSAPSTEPIQNAASSSDAEPIQNEEKFQYAASHRPSVSEPMQNEANSSTSLPVIRIDQRLQNSSRLLITSESVLDDTPAPGGLVHLMNLDQQKEPVLVDGLIQNELPPYSDGDVKYEDDEQSKFNNIQNDSSGLWSFSTTQNEIMPPDLIRCLLLPAPPPPLHSPPPLPRSRPPDPNPYTLAQINPIIDNIILIRPFRLNHYSVESLPPAPRPDANEEDIPDWNVDNRESSNDSMQENDSGISSETFYNNDNSNLVPPGIKENTNITEKDPIITPAEESRSIVETSETNDDQEVIELGDESDEDDCVIFKSTKCTRKEARQIRREIRSRQRRPRNSFRRRVVTSSSNAIVDNSVHTRRPLVEACTSSSNIIDTSVHSHTRRSLANAGTRPSNTIDTSAHSHTGRPLANAGTSSSNTILIDTSAHTRRPLADVGINSSNAIGTSVHSHTSRPPAETSTNSSNTKLIDTSVHTRRPLANAGISSSNTIDTSVQSHTRKSLADTGTISSNSIMGTSSSNSIFVDTSVHTRRPLADAGINSSNTIDTSVHSHRRSLADTGTSSSNSILGDTSVRTRTPLADAGINSSNTIDTSVHSHRRSLADTGTSSSNSILGDTSVRTRTPLADAGINSSNTIDTSVHSHTRRPLADAVTSSSNTIGTSVHTRRPLTNTGTSSSNTIGTSVRTRRPLAEIYRDLDPILDTVSEVTANKMRESLAQLKRELPSTEIPPDVSISHVPGVINLDEERPWKRELLSPGILPDNIISHVSVENNLDEESPQMNMLESERIHRRINEQPGTQHGEGRNPDNIFINGNHHSRSHRHSSKRHKVAMEYSTQTSHLLPPPPTPPPSRLSRADSNESEYDHSIQLNAYNRYAEENRDAFDRFDYTPEIPPNERGQFNRRGYNFTTRQPPQLQPVSANDYQVEGNSLNFSHRAYRFHSDTLDLDQDRYTVQRSYLNLCILAKTRAELPPFVPNITFEKGTRCTCPLCLENNKILKRNHDLLLIYANIRIMVFNSQRDRNERPPPPPPPPSPLGQQTTPVTAAAESSEVNPEIAEELMVMKTESESGISEVGDPSSDVSASTTPNRSITPALSCAGSSSTKISNTSEDSLPLKKRKRN